MGLRLFENPLHLVLLLAVVLIVFGAGKLPSVGAALGQSIKEFKKASNEPDTAENSTKPPSDARVTAAGTACEKCQAVVPTGAQFCPSCGAPARAEVSASADALYCAQCGAKNASAARFCAECGTSMAVHAG